MQLQRITDLKQVSQNQPVFVIDSHSRSVSHLSNLNSRKRKKITSFQEKEMLENLCGSLLVYLHLKNSPFINKGFTRDSIRFMLSTTSDTLCVQFEIISDLKTASKEFSQYFRDKIINRRYQAFQNSTCAEGQIKTAD